MRAPVGSWSTSGAITAASRPSKTSTSSAAPSGSGRGQVDRADGAADRVTERRAPQAPHDLALQPHGLAAVDRQPAILPDGHGSQAARRAIGRRRALGDERLAADEGPLAETDERPHPRLERRILHRQLGPVVPVALLEPERFEGPVADGLQSGAELTRRADQGVPGRDGPAALDGELPAELARVADPRGERRRLRQCRSGCHAPAGPRSRHS